ncbi:salivary endonuclease-like [Lycorma delicatula]|uniref:salivary endonuclease-like n=1 Tax=Lycorma delicatula TaxID=130591 RepID=UPI003F50E7B1
MYFKIVVIVIILTIHPLVEIECRRANNEELQDINISLGCKTFKTADSNSKCDDDNHNYNDCNNDDYKPEPGKKKLQKKPSKKGINQSPVKTEMPSKNGNEVITTDEQLESNSNKKNVKNSFSFSSEHNKAEKSLTDETGFTFLSIEDGATCSLKLNQDINKDKEPIFLVKDKNNNYLLVLPTLITSDNSTYNKGVGALEFDMKETVYLECPGKGNGILIESGDITQSSLEMRCITGTTVSLNSEQVKESADFSKVSCSKSFPGTAIFNENAETCGEKGRLVEIGFLVEGWHKLINVCYNVEETKTLYTSHTLFGSVLAGADVYNKRPNFAKGLEEFYEGFHPGDCYTQESQKQVILEMTGDEKYFQPSDNIYLARGHFSPDGDFILKTWQDATYFFVNAAPQWQCINQGHWLAVENLAREVSMKLKEKFHVTTGPYGILKLKSKNGQYEELFLKPIKKETKTKRKKTNKKVDDKDAKIAVPDYYFKVLHRPSKNECIVFISTNNPFIDKPEEFCKDICEDNNWPKLRDQKKGFVFCCKYEEFKETVPYITEYDCSGGVLKRPK